jgi:hypothetical protein
MTPSGWQRWQMNKLATLEVGPHIRITINDGAAMQGLALSARRR